MNNLARLVATAPHVPPRPAAEAQPPVDAAPAPAEPPPAPLTLTHGGYEFLCTLPGLASARGRIDRDHRLALVVGHRIVDTVVLEGEFYGPDAQVTCADGFIQLLRKQPSGRDRFVSFGWKQGHLEPGLTGNEVP